MKDLSLYLLDLSQNSVAAGATRLDLSLIEADGQLTMALTDNGCGMSPAFLAAVCDPFTTTRTTRKVGMGVPLLRLAAEQTGGTFTIESTEHVGTAVTATFSARHIDCPPLGDLPGTVAALIQGAPTLTVTLHRSGKQGSYTFSTDEIRQVLGEGISLAEPEVYIWMRDYLAEQEMGIS